MGVVREKKIGWPVIILIILAPFILRFAVGLFTGHDIEDVRQIIKDDLYQKYGEEFIVDRVGTRKVNKMKFYQARIYPKSIVGTKKERDSEYYSDATVDILSFGKLGSVSDGYGMIIGREKLEGYLSPKIRELFGNRFLIKSDFKYKIEQDNGELKWYIPDNFENAYNNVKNNPDKYRLELDLDVYIFERIKNEEEKEERRKEIFELVQYLKEAGLFEYLEMGVIFIDERVLAPSYKKYNYEISASRKVKEEIDGETVRIPPRDLREEMSRILQQEVNEMSEEELLASMRKIRKDELEYKKISKYNEPYFVWVCSLNMLKLYNGGMYDKYKKENKLAFYNYQDINNILFARDNRYIYID